MDNYFNKSALLHFLSIVILYCLVSVFFMDFESKADISFGLYVQVAFILVYSGIPQSSDSIFEKNNPENYRLVADSMWVILGIWFTLVDCDGFSSKPSYISAGILLISIITTLKLYIGFIRQMEERKLTDFSSKLSILSFQALILTQVGLLFFVLIDGEWSWNFYDPLTLFDVT